jgi:hypothetical protein
MATEIWIKPSGVEVEITKTSEEAAIALGWVRKNSVVKPAIEVTVHDELAPKRRGRPGKMQGA